MKARYLYSELAVAIQARKNCEARYAQDASQDALDWQDNWGKRICELVNLLPHGSGFDGTNTIDTNRCRADKLVIHTQFHHMNETGYYDGWTEHGIIITPSFDGINLRVTGRNRNDIKDYIAESFDCALRQEVPESFPSIRASNSAGGN